MTTVERLCEPFILVAERFAELHGAPLPKGLLSIGEETTGMECKGWRVRLNTTGEKIDDVDAFTAKVEWNGWPAGILNPYGGCIAAGEAANLGTFLEWLPTAALAPAKGETA